MKALLASLVLCGGIKASSQEAKPTVFIVDDTARSVVVRGPNSVFEPPRADYLAHFTPQLMKTCGDKVNVVIAPDSATYIIRISGGGAVHSITVAKNGIVTLNYTTGAFGNPTKKFCAAL